MKTEYKFSIVVGLLAMVAMTVVGRLLEIIHNHAWLSGRLLERLLEITSQNECL